MKKQTFEQFLSEEVHAKLFPMILDDDLSDHFSDWIGSLDADELLEWADMYGRSQYLAGKEEVLLDPKPIIQ